MVNAQRKRIFTTSISNKVRSGLIAALDLGTTKACCLIAKPKSEGGFEIHGIGHQISNGLRSGAIIDMERTESTIRSTIEAAEKMAGENIRNVIVNVSCGEPLSRLVAYDVSIAGHEIGQGAVLRRLRRARRSVIRRARWREVNVRDLAAAWGAQGSLGAQFLAEILLFSL